MVIEAHTLSDGGQPAKDTAELIAAFLSVATRTLDIALYDFALDDATEAIVRGALHDAIGRGVVVRLMYNVDHAKPIPVPPPPRTDAAGLASIGARTKGVAGIPDLMHHKFVIRDGAAVLTGSTNWTQDSWTREENVILAIWSEQLAAAFARDFEDLWTTGSVMKSGAFTTQAITLDGGATVMPHFCPGRAERLVHRIAGAIGRAHTRVRVASPVITSGPILGTLAERSADGSLDLAGVYDATQMSQVFSQWRANQRASWKIPVFEALVGTSPFAGKHSTPWGAGTIHNFMHAKVVVADDVVFTGSFNLSHSGEANAENVVEIADAGLADRLCSYIDGVRANYAR